MTLIVGAEPVPLVRDDDGVMRVGSTRVTLDSIVAAFHEGMTAEAIAEQYPTIELAQVYVVIGYYLAHREEVQQYLAERRRLAAAVRLENESRFDPTDVMARLLERQRKE